MKNNMTTVISSIRTSIDKDDKIASCLLKFAETDTVLMRQEEEDYSYIQRETST